MITLSTVAGPFSPPNMQRCGSDCNSHTSVGTNFYMDRIDEMIPEKKLVTKKLFKSDMNNDALMFDSPAAKEQTEPHAKFSMRMTLPSPSKKEYEKCVKELKENLIKYKSKQNEVAEKKKTETATALKFLRKLGSKLRKTKDPMRLVILNDFDSPRSKAKR